MTTDKFFALLAVSLFLSGCGNKPKASIEVGGDERPKAVPPPSSSETPDSSGDDSSGDDSSGDDSSGDDSSGDDSSGDDSSGDDSSGDDSSTVPPSDCDGVLHNAYASRTRYSSARVSASTTCSSVEETQTALCEDGVLGDFDGTATHETCSVNSAPVAFASSPTISFANGYNETLAFSHDHAIINYPTYSTGLLVATKKVNQEISQRFVNGPAVFRYEDWFATRTYGPVSIVYAENGSQISFSFTEAGAFPAHDWVDNFRIVQHQNVGSSGDVASLSSMPSTTDPDDDTLTYLVEWQVKGVNEGSYSTVSTGADVTMIAQYLYVEGGTIRARISATDGIDTVEYFTPAVRTVPTP